VVCGVWYTGVWCVVYGAVCCGVYGTRVYGVYGAVCCGVYGTRVYGVYGAVCCGVGNWVMSNGWCVSVLRGGAG